MNLNSYTAFSGERRLARAPLPETLGAVKAELARDPQASILVFDDENGRQVDFDLRGSLEEILGRLAAPEPKRGPGRPPLGVRSAEISLLPRHWTWLEAQQGNISATLRKLVEEAMRNEPPAARLRPRIAAIDRTLWSLAGNLPGAEEVSRALYAQDFPRFRDLVASWPGDIGTHFVELSREAEALLSV